MMVTSKGDDLQPFERFQALRETYISYTYFNFHMELTACLQRGMDQHMYTFQDSPFPEGLSGTLLLVSTLCRCLFAFNFINNYS